MKSKPHRTLQREFGFKSTTRITVQLTKSRYRGLKSFRASPWDAKENLPAEYGKIFQFENFNRTKKRALADIPEAIQAGQYVTLHIANVPVSAMSKMSFRL